MKTAAVALFSLGLLFLAACGGGGPIATMGPPATEAQASFQPSGTYNLSDSGVSFQGGVLNGGFADVGTVTLSNGMLTGSLSESDPNFGVCTYNLVGTYSISPMDGTGSVNSTATFQPGPSCSIASAGPFSIALAARANQAGTILVFRSDNRTPSGSFFAGVAVKQ